MKNEERDELFEGLAEAMALFDNALPEMISLLGADNPLILNAIEAADEVKKHLRDLGYTPPSLH